MPFHLLNVNAAADQGSVLSKLQREKGGNGENGCLLKSLNATFKVSGSVADRMQMLIFWLVGFIISVCQILLGCFLFYCESLSFSLKALREKVEEGEEVVSDLSQLGIRAYLGFVEMPEKRDLRFSSPYLRSCPRSLHFLLCLLASLCSFSFSAILIFNF